MRAIRPRQPLSGSHARSLATSSARCRSLAMTEMSCSRTPDSRSSVTAVTAASSSSNAAAVTMPPAASSRYDVVATRPNPRGSGAPGEDRDVHLGRSHAAVRSTVTEGLTVNANDARSAIVDQHREHLTDAPPRDLGIAPAEQSRIDRLVAVDEEERARIAALQVLLHARRLVGMQEDQARLARERITQEVAQLGIADEIDELVGVGEGVPVIGGEEHERGIRVATG